MKRWCLLLAVVGCGNELAPTRERWHVCGASPLAAMDGGGPVALYGALLTDVESHEPRLEQGSSAPMWSCARETTHTLTLRDSQGGEHYLYVEAPGLTLEALVPGTAVAVEYYRAYDWSVEAWFTVTSFRGLLLGLFDDGGRPPIEVTDALRIDHGRELASYHGDCGTSLDYRMRFESDADTVVLDPGESGKLRVDGATVAVHSYGLRRWESSGRCSDSYSGWRYTLGIAALATD